MTGIYLIIALIFIVTLGLSVQRIIQNALVTAFLVLQVTFNVYALGKLNSTDIEYFTFDGIAVILLTVLTIISVAAFYHSQVFLKSRNTVLRQRGIYFAAMIGLVASLSAVYLSNHLAVTWIFVEMTTLSASPLIYHNRNERTLEATWKYLFVSSVSVTMIFIGILFLSTALPQQSFHHLSYSALIDEAANLDQFWLKLAFIFIFTGFTVKAGVVPMYTVGIDAKDKAPGPAGAMLSTVLINAGFLGIFRTYGVVANAGIAAWASHILTLTGLLSVFLAAVYIIRVKNLKRMLAYSGVEHMGLVMLAVGAGGVGYYAALLHVILHSFAKAALFFQVDQIYRVYRSKSIYDIGDYFGSHTTGAVALLFAFVTIVAIPPSGLFVSELLIFQSLFTNGSLWVLVILLLLLTIIIWALSKNFLKMIFIKTTGSPSEKLPAISAGESVSQFVFIALVIYLGMAPPDALVELIRAATTIIPASA